MLITSSNISSQLASTTPTAFIALLQLFGYIEKEEYMKIPSKLYFCKLGNAWASTEHKDELILINRHPEAPQKFEDLHSHISGGKLSMVYEDTTLYVVQLNYTEKHKSEHKGTQIQIIASNTCLQEDKDENIIQTILALK